MEDNPISEDKSERSSGSFWGTVRGAIDNNATFINVLAACASALAALGSLGIAGFVWAQAYWINEGNRQAEIDRQRWEEDRQNILFEAQVAPLLSSEVSAMPPKLVIHNHGLGPAIIKGVVFHDADGTVLLDTTDRSDMSAYTAAVENIRSSWDRTDRLAELGLGELWVGSKMGWETVTVPAGGSVSVYEVFNFEHLLNEATDVNLQPAIFQWANEFAAKTQVQITVFYSSMTHKNCFFMQFGGRYGACDAYSGAIGEGGALKD